jgi:hypothetical protein
MATNSAGNAGVRTHLPHVYGISKRISYADIGTDNARQTVCILPPRAVIKYGHTWAITGFNDTNGDDLDIGVDGGDDDLFASGVDVNAATTLTTFDDLADANRWSTSARRVTWNFTTAPSGNGTAGEAEIYIEYSIVPELS